MQVMGWNPRTFDEACRRAAGRRAYNRRRRLERARRISALFALLDWEPGLTGRELAARFGVHESTVSRDLRFVREVRARWASMMGKIKVGPRLSEFRPSSFAWRDDARGWEISFVVRHGVRVR